MHFFKIFEFLGKFPKFIQNFTNPVVFFFILKNLCFLLAQIDFFKENLFLSVKRPNSCIKQLSLRNSLFQPKFSHKFSKIYLNLPNFAQIHESFFKISKFINSVIFFFENFPLKLPKSWILDKISKILMFLCKMNHHLSKY